MDNLQASDGFPHLNFQSLSANNAFESSNNFHPTFPHFKDYFQLGSTSYHILHRELGAYETARNESLALARTQCLAVSIDGIHQQVHPDDLEFYLECEKKTCDFFEGLSQDEIPGYKTRFDFRVGKNGFFKRYLQQRVVWGFAKGIIKSFLIVMTDISHLKRDPSCHYSILALAEKGDHTMNHGAFIKAYEPQPFSKREKEIFHHLVQNRDSKEIASKLFISEETVRSHRKNILQKSGCKSTLCLIMKSFENGWI